MEKSGLLHECYIEEQKYIKDLEIILEKYKNRNASIEKPPIGLMPKKFHNQAVNEERLKDICEAVQRFLNAKREIPLEWIEEYNELYHLFNK
jgi:hypothetical protein